MPQKNRTVKGVLSGLLGLVGLSAVAGVLATAAVTPAIAVAGVAGSQALTIFDNLPNSLTPGAPMEPTTFYGTGTDGKPFQLAKFYEQNRVPVKFNQVSPILYDAILSSEDKSFYSHGGVNLAATVKAVVDNVAGTSSRGASTISQQFVKNVLIQECEWNVKAVDDKGNRNENYDADLQACWNEATEAKGAEGIERKLQEMRYAIQIEKDYSKNDILLGYLNVANFGGQTYGIEAASQRYFSTSAKKLNLNQAATLAGIVQNPNRYRIDRMEGTNSKADGWADTKVRRDYVLFRMHENGQITDEQYAATKEAAIVPKLKTTPQGCAAARDQAYFCQYARSVVETSEVFGKNDSERRETLLRGGMKVYTSLDMRIQGPAVQAMRAQVPTHMKGILLGSAGVSIEASTGRVLSIVQNTKFKETADAKKSKGEIGTVFAADEDHRGAIGFGPGSTYKLFTLLDWLEKGHSVNEVLNGRERVISPYAQCGGTYTTTENISNFGTGRGYTGTVRNFTRDSLNTGFLAMAQQLDLCDINKMAKRLGVHWGDGGDVTTYGLGPGNRLADSVKDGVHTDANDPFPTVLGSKSIAPIQMAGAYATVANGGKYCEPRVIDKVVGADGDELKVPETKCTQVIAPEVAATAAYALRGVMEGGTGAQAKPYDGIQVIGKTGTAEAEHTMLVESSTKVTTAVWVGNFDGRKDLKDFWANGVRLDRIRYGLARAIQSAANAAYGGDRFPQPDSSLTRRVMRDLPSVVGMTVDEATKTLEEAGFSVRVGDPVDSTVEKGRVAEQSPGPGRVAGGTTVVLSPSTGTPPKSDEDDNGDGGNDDNDNNVGGVPSVVGMSSKDAKAAIRNAGYRFRDLGCRGNERVTNQNPGPGPQPAGSVITISCDG